MSKIIHITLNGKSFDLLNFKTPIKNDDGFIDASVPEKYFYSGLEADVISKLPLDLQVASVDYAINFLKKTQNNGRRISCINGLVNSIDMYNCYYCDYCKQNINGDYYYCYDCFKDMCNLCYSETNEEIAKKNGAINYHLRKTALDLCQNNHILKPRLNDGIRYCDNSENHVVVSNSDNSVKDDDSFIFTKTLYQGDNNYDLCLSCSETECGKKLIEERKLVLKNNPIECYNNEWGSTMDWIPIVISKDEYDSVEAKNSERDGIFMNCNPDSPYFKSIAFCACDNHGRLGFYKLQKTTLSELLDEINKNEAIFKQQSTVHTKIPEVTNETSLEELRNIVKIQSDVISAFRDKSNKHRDEEDNCEACGCGTTSSIQRFMESKGIQVYFG